MSRQGLLVKVRENEPLRDQMVELEEESWRDRWDKEWERERERFGENYPSTGYLRRTRLAHRPDQREQRTYSTDFWLEALKYLWGRTSAANRKCPKCQVIPLDSQVRDCPVHRIPLHLMRNG